MRCLAPRFIEIPSISEDATAVPCGKCLVCLQNKRADWVFRLEQELKSSHSAAFLTLTYSEKFCPESLSVRHLQLFIKRLRKREKHSRLRYYAVGEYGSKTGRPHYHLLLFNCGDFTNVSRAWMLDGKSIGLVHVGKVTSASIGYCTKYVVQRVEWIDDDHRRKPFSVMSRSYGIGGHYLTDDMVSWHRSGLKNYIMKYGVKGRLPRFYRDKIFWQESVKEKVREFSLEFAKVQELENIKLIRAAGYENVEAIQAEMRNAVLSRVKEKVAYTQIF